MVAPASRREPLRERCAVLVVGLPRSGTTWAARVLSAGAASRLVLEPDNEKTSAAAIGAKRTLGRFPVLSGAQVAHSYERLWGWALSGAPYGVLARGAGRILRDSAPEEVEEMVRGRPGTRLRVAGALGSASLTFARRHPTTGRTVAKSVHACLAVEWLARRFSLEVVVLRRHPASVLASWLELDLPDADRGLDTDPAVRSRFVEPWGLARPGPGRFERAAWHLGLLSSALEEALSRNAHWHVVSHEQLCAEGGSGFGHLYDALGLEWSAGTEAVLAADDQPGTGFEWRRRRAELPGSWRDRLEPSQIGGLRRVLEGFPFQRWSEETDEVHEVQMSEQLPRAPGTPGRASAGN